jgi:hypothetical protein
MINRNRGHYADAGSAHGQKIVPMHAVATKMSSNQSRLGIGGFVMLI